MRKVTRLYAKVFFKTNEYLTKLVITKGKLKQVTNYKKIRFTVVEMNNDSPFFKKNEWFYNMMQLSKRKGLGFTTSY